MGATPPFSSAHPSGWVAFAAAVLRAVTWRAVLLTQALGLIFAVYPWLQQWHQPTQSSLLTSAIRQAIAALLVMLGAFSGDEAVRRGWSVWRAFVVVMLCASVANVLFQELLSSMLGDAPRGPADILNDFFILGAMWGPALVVFLNRRTAQRLLSRLRSGELERVQAERHLVASRLAAAEAQIDPAALLHQLAEVRDLYATGRPEAEQRFEELIGSLRESASRSAAAQLHVPRS